ncbi:hypothetical protein MPER_12015 [Moniliophthora perniciosa FA553]|nr:hypothetical protein MPER_12015 [Moniliophthora perniciosa FA553]
MASLVALIRSSVLVNRIGEQAVQVPSRNGEDDDTGQVTIQYGSALDLSLKSDSQYSEARLEPMVLKFEYKRSLLFGSEHINPTMNVVSQDNDNYGIISPAAGTTVSIKEVTFNPARYFKESPISIDAYLISGDTTSEPKFGHAAKEVVTEMKPNTEITWNNITTQAYKFEVDLTQLDALVPGERTLLIKERYNGFGVSNAMAFWSQSFSLSKRKSGLAGWFTAVDQTSPESVVGAQFLLLRQCPGIPLRTEHKILASSTYNDSYRHF